jgi:hypothetical protein
MCERSEPVFSGFSPLGGSPSWTYGPKRPVLTRTGFPEAGSVPRVFPPCGVRRISRAFSIDSSSGASDSGTVAVCSPHLRYGP